MSHIPELELKTIEEIKRLSARQAINIKINEEKRPKLTDSKFGGMPYWDISMEYPKKSDGTLLMLLAQINLDKLNMEGMNIDNRLPQGGMLQFFIDARDDVYGVDFDYMKDNSGNLKQDGFRVIYHKVVNYAVLEEEIKGLGMPISTDEDMEESPIWGEYGLDIQMKETYISMDDYRFDQYFCAAAKKVGWSINENENCYNQFSKAGSDLLYKELDSSGHWILGYPYFTQTDPRTDIERFNKSYNVQLFQMDSDFGNKNDYIMWGDSGVANFFISENDLANEVFTDILYSWDCC